MYGKSQYVLARKHLFPSSMTILSVVILISFLFTTVMAQGTARDTRSWTDPGGSGLTITFSVPETYQSCESAFDRIFTTGIPSNWSLLGQVEVYWATPSGQELIQMIDIRQNGDLDLTINYPPASTWPDLTSIGNPLRELHVSPQILVIDENGNDVSWVGGDQQFAPGILGPGGQVWDVFCLPSDIPQLGSIGDRVFRDDNSNGIQNGGEPGVPGITVQLKDCSNNILRTTTTNGNGNYLFDGLPAGCYRIGIVPNGFTISPANQGNNDAIDSDVDPNSAMTGDINLGPGEDDPTQDAGLIPAPELGSIGDRVFRDDNSNGIQNGGEPGVPGITVQLKDCSNNILRTTTTNGNGNYLFDGLPAGCYRIGIVPNGFTISPANQGNNDAIDSDVDPNSAMTGDINLGPGEDDPTQDAGLIPQQLICGLTVDQKCVVTPPPSGDLACQAKIAAALFRYTGPNRSGATVRFAGKDGQAIYTNVNLISGETVLAAQNGYSIDARPKDLGSKMSIFVNGVEEELHTSCSTPFVAGQPAPLNSPKGAPSSNWFVLGFVDKEGRVVQIPGTTDGANSCTVTSGSGSVCNGDKPSSLTFRYTGGSCSDTTNFQEGKFECSGNPGSGTVSIRVLKDANKISVSPSSVNVGDEFTVSSTEGKNLKSETQLAIGGQTLNIHTSCSKALNLGDIFGSVELVAANGQRLDTPVTFTFLVSNSGDDLTNVSLEDSFGTIEASFDLAAGASRNFERTTTLDDTFTNLAFVQGFLADGQMCSDEDRTRVTVEPPRLSCDDGKPIALVFEYTAGSCSDTTNPQEGKFECSGTPGNGAVSISVQKDADKISVTPSTVRPGERVTISRTDSKKLSSETILRVGGQSLNIHTSCSKTLNVGDVFGSLRLVQFVPEGFPLPNAAREDTESESLFLPFIAR